MAMEIQLTRGKVALVSDHRYKDVGGLKWYARFDGTKWYAAREMTGGKKVMLHNFIMKLVTGVPNDMEVDHIDGDGLNCVDENLRVCTHSQNTKNRGKNRNSTSGYKGVSWHKATQKWIARIKVDYKEIYLGLYNYPELAAVAYDDAAKRYFGEFANLNFPPQK